MWNIVPLMPAGRRQVGDLGSALAAELRSELARRQIKPGDLATMSGIPASTVSKLLNAATAVDVDQLARLGRTLGIEASELMRRAEFDLAARRGTRALPDVGGQSGDDPA